VPMENVKPKVCHYEDVPARDFGAEAPGVSIRWVIGEADGAPTYALRMIEVAPGCRTPDHSHPFEHENYVVAGRGQVRLGQDWHEIGAGSIVFVPGGLRHCYRNTGSDVLKFLCGIPVSAAKP